MRQVAIALRKYWIELNKIQLYILRLLKVTKIYLIIYRVIAIRLPNAYFKKCVYININI